jgi:glutathione S-transferase
MSIRLHGVPLSQPFRSVAWALLQKRLPFEVKMAVPGSTRKGGTGSKEYLALNPTGNVPFLEDGETRISEAPAILAHLCQSNGWSDLYPYAEAGPLKGKIDEYCHWHHSNTRMLAPVYFAPLVRADKNYEPAQLDFFRSAGTRALDTLESAYLARSPFIGGSDRMTIADLMAYEEVAQLSPKYMNIMAYDRYPNLHAWMGRMEAVPYHTEAHAALAELGDLSAFSPGDKDLMKRVGAASKAGFAALSSAAAKVSAGV